MIAVAHHFMMEPCIAIRPRGGGCGALQGARVVRVGVGVVEGPELEEDVVGAAPPADCTEESERAS